MRMQDFLIGLRILNSTFEEGSEEATMAAQHEEIYVGGPKPSELVESQTFMLEKAGFTWDEGNECWHVFT